jgi:NADH:ubiquinone oxidoreductase subunit 3 (subunit A)
MVTILNMLLHVYASFLFLMWKHYIYLSVISFDTLGVSIFYQNFIFVLILVIGLVYAWRKTA